MGPHNSSGHAAACLGLALPPPLLTLAAEVAELAFDTVVAAVLETKAQGLQVPKACLDEPIVGHQAVPMSRSMGPSACIVAAGRGPGAASAAGTAASRLGTWPSAVSAVLHSEPTSESAGANSASVFAALGASAVASDAMTAAAAEAAAASRAQAMLQKRRALGGQRGISRLGSVGWNLAARASNAPGW